MTEKAPNLMSFVTEPVKTEAMRTLKCESCGMAIYISERKLHEKTWQCPSCGTVTRT